MTAVPIWVPTPGAGEALQAALAANRMLADQRDLAVAGERIAAAQAARLHGALSRLLADLAGINPGKARGAWDDALNALAAYELEVQP